MLMIGNPRDLFCHTVWECYRGSGRHDLPWRVTISPYGVFVSEIMLQQTQVSRVLGRWERWLRRWPGFNELAGASVAEIVGEWQGLGYNRRALALRAAAQMVIGEYGGELPADPAELVRLPGVGANTAGSVAAFAFNMPVTFIETNIRRVYLHHFSELGGQSADGLVSDKELCPLIESTLDRKRPREWYWALMDYGTNLAKRVPNPNRRSRHYAVQSRFEGSLRQLRGEILRQLVTGAKSREVLPGDERLDEVLVALVREGFVVEAGGKLKLAN
jgi:A/G-specific adenine glycosylase